MHTTHAYTHVCTHICTHTHTHTHSIKITVHTHTHTHTHTHRWSRELHVCGKGGGFSSNTVLFDSDNSTCRRLDSDTRRWSRHRYCFVCERGTVFSTRDLTSMLGYRHQESDTRRWSRPRQWHACCVLKRIRWPPAGLWWNYEWRSTEACKVWKISFTSLATRSFSPPPPPHNLPAHVKRKRPDHYRHSHGFFPTEPSAVSCVSWQDFRQDLSTISWNTWHWRGWKRLWKGTA